MSDADDLRLINDHLLKAAFHNAATGKLSDIAAMVVFPVLVAGLLAPFMRRPMRAAIGFTAVFFTAINLWSAADRLTTKAISLVLPSRPVGRSQAVSGSAHRN